jgi:hypothetical protein
LAAGTDVTAVDADDFPDSAVEVPRFAVLAGPEVHPTKTRDTTTRVVSRDLGSEDIAAS